MMGRSLKGFACWRTGVRLVAIGATLALATTGYSQTLTWLGTLGGSFSRAYGVSADGSVVVGESYDASYRVHAFRWENGVMQNLGTLPGS
ncbi:MAG: hypothetical protein ACUVR7_14940, partial [Armatimonadota bacterium]